MGFKVHFTQTCDGQEQLPNVLPQVRATLSTTAAGAMLSPILDDLREQALAPSEHFVDMGYPSGEDLANQADLGTQVIGPAAPTPGWQAKPHRGLAPTDFTLDGGQEQAICPQSQPCVRWKPGQDGQRPIIKISFATATCQQCPVRQHCPHS